MQKVGIFTVEIRKTDPNQRWINASGHNKLWKVREVSKKAIKYNLFNLTTERKHFGVCKDPQTNTNSF